MMTGEITCDKKRSVSLANDTIKVCDMWPRQGCQEGKDMDKAYLRRRIKGRLSLWLHPDAALVHELNLARDDLVAVLGVFHRRAL
jgi:hypothetical protein